MAFINPAAIAQQALKMTTKASKPIITAGRTTSKALQGIKMPKAFKPSWKAMNKTITQPPKSALPSRIGTHNIKLAAEQAIIKTAFKIPFVTKDYASQQKLNIQKTLSDIKSDERIAPVKRYQAHVLSSTITAEPTKEKFNIAQSFIKQISKAESDDKILGRSRYKAWMPKDSTPLKPQVKTAALHEQYKGAAEYKKNRNTPTSEAIDRLAAEWMYRKPPKGVRKELKVSTRSTGSKVMVDDFASPTYRTLRH